MTSPWSAGSFLLALTLVVVRPVRADVWTASPVLGISGDYASNPGLLDIPHTEETHAALLLDSPTVYSADPFKLSILPSFRISNTQGYSSLDSDYEHLSAKGEFDSERSTSAATLSIARDSTLYHDALTSGFTNGSVGVRRDSALIDLDWDRSLTELTDLNIDVDANRVRYDEPAGASLLTDYKYLSVTPSYGWTPTERSKWSISTTGGSYHSLDGTTSSKSLNLQLADVTQIGELWSLSASAGYSRAINKLQSEAVVFEFTQNGIEPVLIPVEEESSQNGAVFSLSVTRQGELLKIVASASRQLAPTGFAFLSRQDIYELTANYQMSPRWTFGGDLRWVEYQVPTFGSNGSSSNSEVTTGYVSLNAAWLWTENLSLTTSLSRVSQRFQAPSPGVASNSISLGLSRRFQPISF